MREFDLGIHAAFTCRDSAWPAGALGDAAVEAGLSVSVYPAGDHPPIYRVWDDRLVRPSTPLTRWLKACRAVAFFDPPPPAVRDAAAAAGVPGLLVYSWLRHPAAALAGWDLGPVVGPTRAAAAHAAAHAAGRPVRRVPWAAGFAPLPTRPQPHARSVVWLADVRRAADGPLDSQAALEQVLKDPKTFVTVLVQGRPSARLGARLRQLTAATVGRADVIRESRPDQLLTILARHDLAAVPAAGDDFALSVLAAQAAGLPVVCYDHPALAEPVADGESGALVPCELADDPAGVPWVREDPKAFAAAVLGVVGHADLVARLRLGAARAARARHLDFVRSVGDVFVPAGDP